MRSCWPVPQVLRRACSTFPTGRLASAEAYGNHSGLRPLRSPRRTSPADPEAEALFAQVQRAFGEIERGDALASNLRRGASGLLRIAATPSLASHLLPEALQAMRSAHPEVACDLWANHTSQIEHDLAAFEIDVGIAIEARERVTLAVVPVTQGEMVLAAPRAWLAGVLRPGGRHG